MTRPPVISYFSQYLYEYHKGVRLLFLLTMTPHEAMAVQKRLEKESVDYFIQKVSLTKVNVFFGRSACIETIRHIVTRPLVDLTPEQDFILGSLLGYDRIQQCERYLKQVKQVSDRLESVY